jgi:hypothetical protein
MTFRCPEVDHLRTIETLDYLPPVVDHRKEADLGRRAPRKKNKF